MSRILTGSVGVAIHCKLQTYVEIQYVRQKYTSCEHHYFQHTPRFSFNFFLSCKVALRNSYSGYLKSI